MIVVPVVALFVVALGYGVIVPLLPDLAGGRAATDETALSVVFAAYSASKIFTQVPGGVWVDHIGARKALTIGLVGFTVSLGGFLVGNDLWWFSFVRVVEGAATGIVYPAVFALAVEGLDPAYYGKRIGLVGGVGAAGMLVGPGIGGLLAPYGVHVPVWVAIGASVVVTAVVLWLVPAGRKEAAERREFRSELGLITKYAANFGFVALVLPVAFNKLTYSAFQGLLPLLGPDVFGIGTTGVTRLFVLTGVLFAVAQPVGGFVSDRFGASATLWVSLPLQFTAMIMMALDLGLWEFVGAYGTWVLVTSVIFTATLKHVTLTYGKESRYGGLFGVFAALTDLALIVGPPLFLGIYGGYGRWVFGAMAACQIPFAFVYLTRSRR